ncbi:glycogen/starch/alpha-glucan phosphorylase [Clostridium tyrobutyricum]|jgi:starch phosphorylase|uniref:glycogen/starch/alpha-glucan phosphorylase n=1 Tax=Clostridium tyrobutyricum TaxID=1519 RepID=UPI00057FAB46|nr:glycogen/starch/alpha-glucan phosphorylase [Clostridium tyrobutyricum]MBV4426275.1 glycogen/starch/alpha-glucan phosphorylase [Clostridium tyrobutyricum]MBV4447279.1 glycogen/starch/alpha-glucan phosphorylase [Clostridium tyrobutyricum]MBV4449861.1 glycogen/starch/alpha-glucan phosphorylase [Clostridium tyrobutyricum]MCH4236697.1 glycogen/starch/alpha-glucan phosphorylase [Clostridium tyrobutyricum]MCH4259769.1 glycogen/starch/alpha-glucan phosphorylase [Clostridium tyrobutyricum]
MLSIDKETFKKDYRQKFIEIHGKDLDEGTDYNKYEALGSLVRDYVAKMWIDTNKKYKENSKKQVYYFSMEFLLGRLLGSNLLNLGIRDTCKAALDDLGIDLDKLENLEEDQGLGNGGLGRLAACFLDSMASLSIPGHGCGIRYKYGFFSQKIINDSQVEVPDDWLKRGNIWEIKKTDKARVVKFGGDVRVDYTDGNLKFNHTNYDAVLAVPYDMPIVGYKNNVVNTLRLWSAEPLSNEFDFSSFNRGDFKKAMEYRDSVESISQILYPDDSFYEGKVLRLKQQYFFVSAGLQSIIHHFKSAQGNMKELDEKIAVHINDTHPTLAIPELMRILIDEEGFGWDTSWRMTNNIMSYTNHTIMAEALEKWPIEMFKKLLPRIFMIVQEIDKRFCSELKNKYVGQWDKVRKMAIIDNGYIKMAHLAIVGSHSVNGVAKLHTEILKKQEMSDFYYCYPNKFNNKTNGITHRRWLISANPKLTMFLKEKIGDSFITHPTDMINFEKFAHNIEVQNRLRDIKLENKRKLADLIYKDKGINIDISSIFDVQIKRIHAYKRQILNCLRIMDLYNRLIENPNLDIVPRTFIFAGKSAPGYYLAKDIITLINMVADKINNDDRVNKKIKVIFMENYRVSLAEVIIPAADVSEQISTTTKEASGTSNMKFMMNGAVTIATLDGANVEIRDEVGDENIVIFGLTEKQVLNLYKTGGYVSQNIINNDVRLKKIINSLVDGTYCKDKNKFKSIYENLVTYNDEFFVIKDFYSYLEAQEKIDRLYRDKSKWQRMCAVNIAHSGIFSSDRTIREYATGIWGSKCLYKNLE